MLPVLPEFESPGYGFAERREIKEVANVVNAEPLIIAAANGPCLMATPAESANAEHAEILQWLWAGGDPA